MKPNRTPIIVGLLALGLTTSALASQTYTLKGAPVSGSQFDTVLGKGSLPFDKRYFELSESERSNFRARFSAIDNTQIPPFPRDGLGAVYRPLIEANEVGAKGKLNVMLEINERGQVEELTIVNAPNTYLANATYKALKKTKFEPAYCAGEPCKMEFPVQVTFK